MFCSTIIPTIGRPSLGRAVESVLSQQVPGDNFEVIVVNDSGNPLPNETWQQSEHVQLIHTNRHNRSVARNAGAAIARGRYLHFLDDDDWMMSGVFEDFWQLAHKSSATWIYGAFRLVDNTGKTIADIIPKETENCLIQLLAFEWLPIQASMIKSDVFFRIGGFDSLPPFSRIFQDVDLSRQVALHYEMAQIDKIVCCIRTGSVGSTTNHPELFVANRQSREKVLNAPGAFTRMRGSAHISSSYSSYWYGKIVYYYLASAKWHVQRKSLLTAISRTIYATIGTVSASRDIFSSAFWHGVLKPHYPRVGRALVEYEEDLFANKDMS